MESSLKIAWRRTEEELYDLYRRKADLARLWRALDAKVRGSADSGEGGGGGEPPLDSTVVSVV